MSKLATCFKLARFGFSAPIFSAVFQHPLHVMIYTPARRASRLKENIYTVADLNAYPSRVPVHQYVYFALSSNDTSAAEMTAVLGIEPDEISVRGSRTTEPVSIPACHRWKVVCREPGLRVDEQVAAVLARLAPHTEEIAALARRLDAEDAQSPSAALEVVHMFGFGADQQAPRDVDDDSSESPKLLGWHLDRTVLDFLHATGAALDVDEYE